MNRTLKLSVSEEVANLLIKLAKAEHRTLSGQVETLILAATSPNCLREPFLQHTPCLLVLVDHDLLDQDHSSKSAVDQNTDLQVPSELPEVVKQIVPGGTAVRVSQIFTFVKPPSPPFSPTSPGSGEPSINQQDNPQFDPVPELILTESPDPVTLSPKRTKAAPKGLTYPAAFDAAWAAYPRRPNDSKRDAFKAWSARIKTGVAAEALLAGAQRYAAWITARGEPPEYTKQGATFFGPAEHYQQPWTVVAPVPRVKPLPSPYSGAVL